MSPSARHTPSAPLLVTLSLGLLACHGDGRRGSVMDASVQDAGEERPDSSSLPFIPVIDQSEWRNYAPELDPLPSHQPEVIRCNIAGWFVEYGSLEVSTGDCNYILVEHPAQVAVPQGATVQMELVHFDLLAPEPATAHVALFFADELQWELEIPIPGLAYVYKESFQATRALAKGEPIRFHLHNHGQNTWLLESLYAQVPAE